MTRTGVAIALLCAAVSSLQAQDTGTIVGVVRSEAGAPVAAAAVSVRGFSRPPVLSANDGRFVVTGVPAGTWTLVVRRIGFRPARHDVSVVAGARVPVDVALGAAPVSVDAVVVEALIGEGERTHELAELLRVPPVGTANVTTVTSSEIEAVHATDPWDLVRETTGIEIHEQGQGPGFASDAVIRGFTSDHSADVALMLDGVPINEPINGHGEGYADWNLIFPGAIADIQVVKGPVSPLFGNNAAGGTVNVITRAAADGTRLEVQGGSFTSGGATLTTGLRKGPWGAFVGGHLGGTEGWRSNQSHLTGQLLGRLNRRMSNALVLDGSLHYYETSWDSPGYLSVSAFNSDALRAATDPTDGGAKRRVAARVSAMVSSGALDWQTTAWGYDSDWELFLNIPELGGDGEGLGTQTEEQDHRHAIGGRSQVRWTPGAWEVTGGIEAQRHWADYDLHGTTARRRDTTVSRYDAAFTTAGSYLGVARTLGRVVRLEGGIRGDLLRATSTDIIQSAALPTETHTIVSPKFGAVLYLRDDWHLYGTAARGFRTASGLLGDPLLHPVSVWDFEVGTRFALQAFDVSASVFRLETSHERLFNPVTLQVESDGESVREGIEVEGAFRPFRTLEISSHWTINTKGQFFLPASGPAASVVRGSFQRVASGPDVVTHTTAAQHHPEDQQGEVVPGVADYVGRAGIMVTPVDRLALHGWVTITGPYIPLGEPDAETQTYTIANVRGTFALTPRMEIAAGLANVFDERAVELRASGFINPAPPRSLRVSIRTRL